MARRYGRNQRRRARELIAQQHEELATLRGTIHRERHQLRAATEKAQALKQVLDEARYILGDSSALPPQSWDFSLSAGEDSFEAWNPLRPRMPLSLFEGWPEKEAETVSTERMYALFVTLENRDTMAEGTHCLVQLAGKKVAYAISGSALRALPQDALRLRLTREIARQLVDLLATKLARRL